MNKKIYSISQQDLVSLNSLQERGFQWIPRRIYDYQDLADRDMYEGYFDSTKKHFYLDSEHTKEIPFMNQTLYHDLVEDKVYLYNSGSLILLGEIIETPTSVLNTTYTDVFSEKTGSLESVEKTCVFPLVGGPKPFTGYRALPYIQSTSRIKYRDSRYYVAPLYVSSCNYSAKLPFTEDGVRSSQSVTNYIFFEEGETSWLKNCMYSDPSAGLKPCTNLYTFEDYGLKDNPPQADDAFVIDFKNKPVEKDYAIVFKRAFNITVADIYTLSFYCRYKANTELSNTVKVQIKSLSTGGTVRDFTTSLEGFWNRIYTSDRLTAGSYELTIIWPVGVRTGLESLRFAGLLLEKGYKMSAYDPLITHVQGVERETKQYPLVLDLKQLEKDSALIDPINKVYLKDPWCISYRRVIEFPYGQHVNILGDVTWGFESVTEGLETSSYNLFIKIGSKESKITLTRDDFLEFLRIENFKKSCRLFEFLVFNGDSLDYYIWNSNFEKYTVTLTGVDFNSFYTTPICLTQASKKHEDLYFNLLLGGRDLTNLSGDIYSDFTIEQQSTSGMPEKKIRNIVNKCMYLQDLVDDDNNHKIHLRASKFEEV